MSRLRVSTDKTQGEHNESAFTPTAAQKQTFKNRRFGPEADITDFLFSFLRGDRP
jgi:uncharacterized protein YukJ